MTNMLGIYYRYESMVNGILRALKKPLYFNYFIAGTLAILSTNCSPKGGAPSEIVSSLISDCNRTSPLVVGPTEKSYCSSSPSYSGVTITGTAQFQARIVAGGLSGLLGPGAAQPIRRAEVEVADANGTVVQCGETDGSGNFSLDIPTGSSEMSLKIRSRGDNSFIKASVMKCPEENVPYEISAVFTPNSSKSIGNVLATVDGEVLGGAFNIFDQLLQANEYLVSKAGGCTTPYTNCTNFDATLNKIEVFWETGFTPAAYSGSSIGSSFYIPSSGRLFILGGINGDINSTDTDHFDNSIILHEYAHFLEDKFSISNSPGGKHSGNAVIDPRLAWSEGFANFFQAAVSGSPFYTDTFGNIDGVTSSFSVNLEVNSPQGSVLDFPKNPDEGNFREFSVARMLLDTEDNTGGEESVDDRFVEIWATITGSDGFKYTENAYRSVGLLHEARDTITANSDWSPLRTLEKHQGDRTNYAKYLQAHASCTGTTFTIDPEMVSGLDTEALEHGFKTSHLLINNDFYHYKHPGGNFKVTIDYTTASLPEADLDIFIYKDKVRFGVESDMINTIASGMGQTQPDQNVGTAETDTVTESSLAAGDYLINVSNYTGTGSTSTTTYSLIINKDIAGELTLCSGTL